LGIADITGFSLKIASLSKKVIHDKSIIYLPYVEEKRFANS
jgi:hypothetical protein